jgi:uncharacterized protein YjdB
MKKNLFFGLIGIALFFIFGTISASSEEVVNEPQSTVENEITETTTSEQAIQSSQSTTETTEAVTTSSESITEPETTAEKASAPMTLNYSIYNEQTGWQANQSNGAVAEYPNGRIEALKINIEGSTAELGTIQYRAHVADVGWQNFADADSISGISGKRMEAVQIQLTETIKANYDIYYRLQVQNFGWMDWAANGQTAGTTGFSYEIKGIQIQLVEKGQTVPGKTARPFVQYKKPNIKYQSHIQDIGWQGIKTNGELSGTTGQSKRMEAMKIAVDNAPVSGGIEYRSHVQDIGWQGYVANNAMTGTMKQSKRMEALSIRLTGELAQHFDVYYRVHAKNFGWMDWASNGQDAGTSGFSYQLESIEIRLVKKGTAAPGAVKRYFVQYKQPTVTYQSHVQDKGWQAPSTNGQTNGSTGQSKRVEAIKVNVANAPVSGSIEYRTHVQDKGWQHYVTNNQLSGTTGQSKRVEAYDIRLTGELAKHFDIYYRGHIEKIGNSGWNKNSGIVGSSGFSLRLEAIEIQLVRKNQKAPTLSKSFWENKSAELNVPFINQYASNAPMGCEAASLLQALKTLGYAKNYTLTAFLNEMPISYNNDPNNGFAGNPYIIMTNGVYQSIFAKPLANWGTKYGNVQNISGSSASNLKLQLTLGRPVVVYVTYNFESPTYGYYFWGKGVDNAHIMTLAGYNSTTKKYLVSDPAKGKYWVDYAVFEKAYNLTKGAVVVR